MQEIDISTIHSVSEQSDRIRSRHARTECRSLLTPATGLLVAIEVLEVVEQDMAARGMDEEAASVATVIADLSWQRQELTRGGTVHDGAVVPIRHRPGDSVPWEETTGA
jgi:hypothetical protein